MARQVVGVGLLLLLCVGASFAKGEKVDYPPGDSVQTYDGVPFDVRMPAQLDASKRYGLILIEPGSVSELDALSDEPYIVVHPNSPGGGLWSGGHVKVIRNFVEHLIKSLPIDRDNVHAVASGSTSLHGIFEMIAFRKGAPYVSATYVRSSNLRASVAPTAKKRMGVLAFDWNTPAKDGEGVKDIVEDFAGKVRVVELRKDEDELSGAYFKYWLHVMGGGFTPGHDLSLRWVDEAPSLAQLKDLLRERDRGGLVYFFSKDGDATSKEARTLQNAVFFEARVRDAADAVVCLKLDRAAHAALFDALGAKATPCVVVLDKQGAVSKVLQGKIKAKALASALKKVTPRSRR